MVRYHEIGEFSTLPITKVNNCIAVVYVVSSHFKSDQKRRRARGWRSGKYYARRISHIHCSYTACSCIIFSIHGERHRWISEHVCCYLLGTACREFICRNFQVILARSVYHKSLVGSVCACPVEDNGLSKRIRGFRRPDSTRKTRFF